MMNQFEVWVSKMGVRFSVLYLVHDNGDVEVIHTLNRSY